jgi:hypothetical protein
MFYKLQFVGTVQELLLGDLAYKKHHITRDVIHHHKFIKYTTHSFDQKGDFHIAMAFRHPGDVNVFPVQNKFNIHYIIFLVTVKKAAI